MHDPSRRRLLKLAATGTLGLLALSRKVTIPPELVAADDPSGPAGTWYLVANAARLTVTIAVGGSPGTYQGTLAPDGGASRPLTAVAWDAAARLLSFQDGAVWYRATVTQGVLMGRFAETTDPGTPPQVADFYHHVTGWNSDYLDRDIVPRVFEIAAGSLLGRLRVDRAADGTFTGRLKYYADTALTPPAAGEQLEYDLEVTGWDGTNLAFVRHDPNWTETYTGTVSGRRITGTFARSDGAQGAWSGVRAEVLGYGLTPKSPADRAAWQTRTRAQLMQLMMAGNPAPASVDLFLATSQPARTGAQPFDRDDNPGQRAQQAPYTLTEMQIDCTIPDPYGGPAIARRLHAWLAVPVHERPGARYPAVLALNGHEGSGWQVMDPTNVIYWYGEAFARRRFVVLALDIGHRPYNPPLYPTFPGDGPAGGNGPHRAVTASEFAPYASATAAYGDMAYADAQSDWEENGERTWDTMRAVDYLL